MVTKSILVIDDCDDFRSTVSEILLNAGYDVWDVPCPEAAFKLLDRERFDVVICDLNMPLTFGPEMNDFIHCAEVGRRTIGELIQVFPDLPIIAITAEPRQEIVKVLQDGGVVATLGKPFCYKELLKLLENSEDLRPGKSIH